MAAVTNKANSIDEKAGELIIAGVAGAGAAISSVASASGDAISSVAGAYGLTSAEGDVLDNAAEATKVVGTLDPTEGVPESIKQEVFSKESCISHFTTGFFANFTDTSFMDMQQNIDDCIDTKTTYGELAKVDLSMDMSGPIKFVDSIYSMGKASGGLIGSITSCKTLMEDSV